jgi:SsrA-binding protein
MKIIATNRRAKFDYDLKESLIAGIALSGAEVKSTKSGHISLKGSFVNLNRGELYLVNAHITPYKYASDKNADPTRSRKLLVHKKELARLTGLKLAGMSLVPTAVGLQRSLIKIEIGIGRGRKKFDKREVAKKRQAERDITRQGS